MNSRVGEMKNTERKTDMKPQSCIIAILGMFLLPALAWPASKPPLPSQAARPALPAGLEKLLAKERYDELIRTLRREKTALGGRRSFLLGHAHLKLKQ